MREDYRRRLLRLARETLHGHLGLGPGPGAESWALWPESLLPGGVFVTLKTLDGSLRGCLGKVQSSEPRWQTVEKLTAEAACEDPRFAPVRPEEAGDLRISLSLLSEPATLSDYRQIRLGVDGVILWKGSRHGLFLPEVPLEQGWDLPETLHHLARKAGLHPDSWRDSDCRFEIFQSQHFGE